LDYKLPPPSEKFISAVQGVTPCKHPTCLTATKADNTSSSSSESGLPPHSPDKRQTNVPQSQHLYHSPQETVYIPEVEGVPHKSSTNTPQQAYFCQALGQQGGMTLQVQMVIQPQQQQFISSTTLYLFPFLSQDNKSDLQLSSIHGPIITDIHSMCAKVHPITKDPKFLPLVKKLVHIPHLSTKRDVHEISCLKEAFHALKATLYHESEISSDTFFLFVLYTWRIIQFRINIITVAQKGGRLPSVYKSEIGKRHRATGNWNLAN